MSAIHKVVGLFLLSLLCVAPILTISAARSRTGPPAELFPLPRSRHLQGAWIPRSHGRQASVLASISRTGSLRKRTPPGSNNPSVTMRMISLTYAGLILPVDSAARALEDFYSSIALKAAGVWQSSPPSYNLAIEDGPFRLTFASMGDTIPWDNVKLLADRLWQCASLGLTNTFDAMYMDDAGQIAVSVSLRLIEGSSSSSGTDFREGSVPSVVSPSD